MGLEFATLSIGCPIHNFWFYKGVCECSHWRCYVLPQCTLLQSQALNRLLPDSLRGKPQGFRCHLGLGLCFWFTKKKQIKVLMLYKSSNECVFQWLHILHFSCFCSQILWCLMKLAQMRMNVTHASLWLWKLPFHNNRLLLTLTKDFASNYYLPMATKNIMTRHA